MSVAGQKYHYRLMRLLRTIYHGLFLGTDGYRFAPYFADFDKNRIKISALTGGLGASSIVASPFLAHQLMYLCNRIFGFQSTRQGIKKIPSMCRQREDLFYNHF